VTEATLPKPPPGWRRLIPTALSSSIGRGIRGNSRHGAGAMIAGVLAAIAVVLPSARDDW